MKYRAQGCGLALIEVLISFAVLALGLTALLRLQTGLRLSADLSRQRSVALHLVQDDTEALRAYSRLDTATGNGPAWSDITSTTLALTPAGNAAYTLQRQVQTAPRLKHITTTLNWADRTGAAQVLQFDTLIAAADPALSGALLLQRKTGRPTTAANRHALVPISAQSLGDGRSAFKPQTQDTLTWLFDERTGQVIARCDSATGLANSQINVGNLGNCRAIVGLLITGRVRFATDNALPGRMEAEQPLSPVMNLDLHLQLSGTGYPATPGWECRDDSVEALAGDAPSIKYFCVVQGAGLPPRWSGRLDVLPIGWAIAGTGSAYRICRYSADHDRNGRIDNPEHPAVYSQVATALGDQNFLVVRAAAACPMDSGVASADLSGGLNSNWIDDSTMPHQP